MQRKRGELGPIGEALADLSGPLQARHHFTRFDQVDQLVGASEANPERGFMARMMTLCSLPRTNPGNRIRYVRHNGPYTLYMTAGGGNKLPASADAGLSCSISSLLHRVLVTELGGQLAQGA